ncbi:unnamed protein product [Larinioides sclopetarius]|uniref:Uncharacterized protein n=1 Tax=Larinioides sclopetarius TaxID=280406 RepID=A0AAV2C1B1_9ARAC
MSERGEFGASQVPYQQLYSFASSLFGYLYFHLNMHSYRVSTSEHFKEIIGRAIFRIRKDTHKFNAEVLESCGYTDDKLSLCQKICNSYPNNDYFRKLYYISTFILEMMFWWHTTSDAVDLSMGPSLWITIFRNSFESEFQIHGGWQGFAEAGNECCQLLSNEILPGEALLPAYFQGVIAAIGRLNPPSPNVEINETLEALESLNFIPMETDDASVDEAAQVAESVREIEENRPVESKEETEEDQSEEVVERSKMHSPALGGNVVQTENPCEGTSEKSEEGTSERLGNRSLRKRRHNSPPKSDSDSEPEYLSPSKAKMDRK